MNLEEPLLDNTSGGDREGHHCGDDQSGLPSWLDPVNDEDHRSLMSGISGSGDGSGNQNVASWADEPLNSSSRRDGNRSDLPRLILGVRIINIAAAIALITCSFFSMQGIQSPAEWVLSVYGTAAGLLLFSLETQLKFLRHRIADSFGFLYAPLLRFLFLLLTASVAWLHHHLFSDAVAICLVVVAFINLYAMCCYPEHENEREVLIREEDRRLGRLIRKEMTGKAARQATGTESDWL